jgi:hypothetical protein
MKNEKGKSGSVAKISFGRRKEGQHSKGRKPKAGRAKKYRGQGR